MSSSSAGERRLVQMERIATTRAALADHFGLSEEERAERIPSGRVTTLQNRVGWAATYAMLAQHPERIDLSVLKQFEEFEEFRKSEPTPAALQSPEQHFSDAATAEERMDAGYRELRSALTADLLDRVREGSWEFFEQLVLDVLKAMGYGGPEGSVERLGGGGADEGVDGVIREDALGLDLIYVQAKSWEGPVGRPEIQKFFGALHGKRAGKGVFITTSKFSADAREYARDVTPRVILVDGRQVAELMIEHDVGVTVQQTFELKSVNLDYFVEGEGSSG